MKYTVLVKPGSKVEGVFDIAGEPLGAAARAEAGSELASRTGVEPNAGLVVRTHARAHDGEANKAVVKLLAKHFGVAKSCVRIISGATSKHKTIEITE